MTYYDFNPLYDNEDDKDKTGSTISGLSTGETGKMGITLFPDRAGFLGRQIIPSMSLLIKTCQKRELLKPIVMKRMGMGHYIY